jgi:uncharacterized membrane protein
MKTSWIVILFAVSTLLAPFLSTMLNVFLFQILLLAFAFFHGQRRFGIKGIIVFFLIAFIVSNVLENISIVTGFPFGHFYYADLGVPFLFNVPITIGPMYFAMGYVSWSVASTLLKNKATLLTLPLVAAFLMTMWDVVMDPISATIDRAWTWVGGGSYFGVPLSNFFGWFITVFIFYILFAVYLKKYGHSKNQSARQELEPASMYFLVGLSYIFSLIAMKPGYSIDGGGTIWQNQHIYTSVSLISFFTMIFISIFAALHLLSKENQR